MTNWGTQGVAVAALMVGAIAVQAATPTLAQRQSAHYFKRQQIQ